MFPQDQQHNDEVRPFRALPAKHTLEWWKIALELLLLLLAVPWLVRELTRHPGKVSRAAAKKHLAG